MEEKVSQLGKLPLKLRDLHHLHLAIAKSTSQCTIVVFNTLTGYTCNMSSQSLSSRLQALSDSYKQTLDLIQRLQKLPANPGSVSPDADPRIELASEIRQSLQEQDDTLEIVRQEVDDGMAENGPVGGRWVGGGSVTRRRDSEREQERERNAATVARLGEDLKAYGVQSYQVGYADMLCRARVAFRRAQLQAKRNADTAKRKEREMLFANRSADAENLPPARRKGQEKLTQDELALNASSDVTAALRRTHDLLQGNLQQSQYAQQTLDESTGALNSLGESYAGLGDMLKNSRGLVGQLLRSQKSDTWYLETAFFILCATIAWLVFRRIVYGPAWWLVWQPLRWGWWFFTSMLAGMGIVGGQKAVTSPGAQSMASGLNSNGVPTFPAGRPARSMMVGGKGGGWDRPQEPPAQESMVEQIGKIAQQSQEGTLPSEAEREGSAGAARNTKKRMMEVEPPVQSRDEL